MLDTEWETWNWGREKLNAALETLYQEVTSTDEEDRRHLAIRMVRHLLVKHKGSHGYETLLDLCRGTSIDELQVDANDA